MGWGPVTDGMAVVSCWEPGAGREPGIERAGGGQVLGSVTRPAVGPSQPAQLPGCLH